MPAVPGPPRPPRGTVALRALELGALEYLAAGAAAVAAGAVNAVAGGGTLISFPALIGIGVPAVPANITNTVSLLPGYLGGSWAQRADLEPQLAHAKALSAVSAVGGLAGSVLLLVIPARSFRLSVPYLILLACALLLAQDRMRQWLVRDGGRAGGHHAALVGSSFLAAVYGGFFGAGLGIMLLAILGLFRAESLVRLNALKQALSFVINLVAAVFFLFSGRVVWELVPVMAVASLVGGALGARSVHLIPAVWLRRLVVVTGVAVAVALWVG